VAFQRPRNSGTDVRRQRSKAARMARNALLYTPTSLAGYWTAWRTEIIGATAGTPDELNTKSI
jgi:hypothetical protein